MMKIKLDENLGTRGKEIFKKNGFDVQTVHDEGLCSASDTTLIKICIPENKWFSGISDCSGFQFPYNIKK